jgi:hypothetical protein
MTSPETTTVSNYQDDSQPSNNILTIQRMTSPAATVKIKRMTSPATTIKQLEDDQSNNNNPTVKRITIPATTTKQ